MKNKIDQSKMTFEEVKEIICKKEIYDEHPNYRTNKINRLWN